MRRKAWPEQSGALGQSCQGPPSTQPLARYYLEEHGFGLDVLSNPESTARGASQGAALLQLTTGFLLKGSLSDTPPWLLHRLLPRFL